MLTATQKKTAEALVNIFETGEVLGDYGQVTLIAGDTGHLTFGRSQTTLGSGNLNELMQRYCANSGARFGTRLASYLPRFAARDLKLDKEFKLHNLLRTSADDNVMRDTQDTFFDETYWQPAAHSAELLKITSPLGVAVVYDSFVHGSWKLMRNRTTQQVGDITSASEQKWIAAYIAIRRAWLAENTRADLRATVYRMDTFQRLIDQGYWGLELPLVVRGQEISSVTLSATPRGCYDGPQPGTRSLALQSPLQRGLDVRLLQLGLSDRGVDINADGIFGQTSQQLIKKYQSTHGLPMTGVADVALIAQLVA
ncbi:chitosanase [Candidatus Nitrotoga sp. 1052]|uniref:chitosanase n=1 Tax=Candidatus Nitrotoga sp. 1052 TaxID=2886964 RepID=UPI001EF4281C|nr:peptidoglycan-binding protein [Candidatus Nitrotoga sp. 1052]CAH1082222.1 Chitosanase [Candidatus Nitrotoga sp. 1052]